MALTRKGLAYLLVAYTFVGMALIFREPALTVFVIPNALLLFFFSRPPPDPNHSFRVLRKTRPTRSFGGENINVALAVSNDSARVIDELQLTDHMHESLTLESGTNALTMSLGPHERVEFSYKISAPRRGTYTLGPVSVLSTDMLGFHEYTREISVYGDLTILPNVEKLGAIELRARRVGPWPGMVPSRKIGPGSEFFELRLYEAGDELRRLNWKSSARLGRLIVNEFEGEQVTDVLVVVDCSEGALSKLFDFDVPELEVDLAASLCSQLVGQGNRVGLSVYGAVRTWVDPAFGKRQLLRLLNSLAAATAGRPSVPMQYAVESVIVSMFPARSVIVFISPVLGEEIVSVITNLAERGYGLICFTPIASSNASDTRDTCILARRILTDERKIKLAEVMDVARVIEFSPKTDIRPALRRWRPWRNA